MVEAASDDEFFEHLLFWLNLECEGCKRWEHFDECWNGLEPSNEGAKEFARRAFERAKADGWLRLRDDDCTVFCPKCRAAGAEPPAGQLSN